MPLAAKESNKQPHAAARRKTYVLMQTSKRDFNMSERVKPTLPDGLWPSIETVRWQSVRPAAATPQMSSYRISERLRSTALTLVVGTVAALAFPGIMPPPRAAGRRTLAVPFVP